MQKSDTKNIANTALAHNIKYLRKKNNLSQEALAEMLEIKRSNIAAYESKNVEPRLRIILQLAKFFEVSVQSLIEKKIQSDEDIDSMGSMSPVDQSSTSSTNSLRDQKLIDDFITKSEKIKKVLEGFKAFYNFKKEQLVDKADIDPNLLGDIDNFLQLMEHLLKYNDDVIENFNNPGKQ